MNAEIKNEEKKRLYNAKPFKNKMEKIHAKNAGMTFLPQKRNVIESVKECTYFTLFEFT